MPFEAKGTAYIKAAKKKKCLFVAEVRVMGNRWILDYRKMCRAWKWKLQIEARSGRPWMPNGEVWTLLPDPGNLLKSFQERISYLKQPSWGMITICHRLIQKDPVSFSPLFLTLLPQC